MQVLLIRFQFLKSDSPMLFRRQFLMLGLLVLAYQFTPPSYGGTNVEHTDAIVKIVVTGTLEGSNPSDSEPEVTKELHGTGFFVDSTGYIVTANHVINPKDAKWKKLENGKLDRKIRVHYADNRGVIDDSTFVFAEEVLEGKDVGTAFDFALLETRAGANFSTVRCSFEAPSEGQRVSFKGFPKNEFGETSYETGNVGSPLKAHGAGVGTHEVNLLTVEGNSGSPVFSVADGKAVGFVVQGVKIRNDFSDGKPVEQYRGLFISFSNIENLIPKKWSCLKPDLTTESKNKTINELILSSAIQSVHLEFEHSLPNLTSELSEHYNSVSTKHDKAPVTAKSLSSLLTSPIPIDLFVEYFDRGWSPELILYTFVRYIELDRDKYKSIERSRNEQCDTRKGKKYNKSTMRRLDLISVCFEIKRNINDLRFLRCDSVKSIVRISENSKQQNKLIFSNNPRDRCELLRFQLLMQSLYIVDWIARGVDVAAHKTTKVTEKVTFGKSRNGEQVNENILNTEVFYEKIPTIERRLRLSFTDAYNRSVSWIGGNENSSNIDIVFSVRSAEEAVLYLGDHFFTQLAEYGRYNARMLVRKGRGVKFFPFVKINRSEGDALLNFNIRVGNDFYSIPTAASPAGSDHVTWRMVELISNALREMGVR